MFSALDLVMRQCLACRLARRFLNAALALAMAAGAAFAQQGIGPRPQAADDAFVPEPAGIQVETWVEGLEIPWSLVFLPDGRALVSERPGRIRLIEDGRLAAQPVASLAVATGGEGGLMGLALHPDYPRAPFLYAMHTEGEGSGRTNQVVRLVLTGNQARFDRVILGGIVGGRNHNGGRIAFGPDRHLYIGTGEIFEASRAQDRSDLAGKILRVTPEGAIPADNPFPGSPVFSLGHRNVQGLAWHPVSGVLFASEHGPSGEFGLRAYDEINVVRHGLNYGWPLVVGAPKDPAFVDPIAAWPDTPTPPGGIAFWRGDLFVATLRSRALLRIVLDDTQAGPKVRVVERWFADASGNGRFGRLRDAVAGPDGALYVLTSNRDGRGVAQAGDDRILRLTPRP